MNRSKNNLFNLAQFGRAGFLLVILAFGVFAQTPDNSAKMAQAQAAFAEAMKLLQENTAESLRAALPKLGTMCRLLNEVGEKKGEAFCNIYTARTLFNLNDKTAAVEKYNLALAFFRAEKDAASEALTLREIGENYSGAPDGKRAAIEYFVKSLPLFKSLGDKKNEADMLNFIGKIYNDLQDNRKALEYFLQALPLRRELKDVTGEGQTLSNLGRVYSDLGENQKALEYLKLALPIRRATRDRYGEALTLNNTGKIYQDLGEYQKALEFYVQALPIFKELKDDYGYATALLNVGVIYDALGDAAKAVEFSNQALTIQRATGNPAGIANALNNLGSLNRKKGDAAQARKFFNEALSLAREAGDTATEAKILNNLAIVDGESGKFEDAINNYIQALPLLIRVEDTRTEAATLANLMTFWNDTKNPRTAILFGKQAINKYQILRRGNEGLSKETQQTYLKTVEHAYRYLAELLVKEKRFAEAQQILNAFKDQQFFDFDQTRTRPIKAIELTRRESNFINAYESIGKQLGDSQKQFNTLVGSVGARQPTAEESAQAQKIDRELNQSVILFVALLANSVEDFSGAPDKDDQIGQIADTREMQETLRKIAAQTGQKTVAVYQIVGEKDFYSLLVTADLITSVSAAFDKAAFDEKTKRFWALLQSPQYDPNTLGKEIYDVVFKPLEAILPKDAQTIMWSLDGNLRYVPMAALYDGKGYLVERYNHVNFTRADGERLTRDIKPSWTGYGFGTSAAQTVDLLGERISFEALPGVGAELDAIFKSAPTQIVSGDILPDAKFTKQSFLDALKKPRPLIHIASHFAFQAGDEARSFLLLGDGSAFTLEEMKTQKDLFAGADLLTLSACNTAAAQAGANGREVDAFSELAQRLGAGAVLATLWSVADSSTPVLMKNFYDLKLNKKLTKAEALRQSQMELLQGKTDAKPTATRSGSTAVQIVVTETDDKSKGNSTDKTRSGVVYLNRQQAPVWDKTKYPPFAHPFYWSPFILIGNWR